MARYFVLSIFVFLIDQYTKMNIVKKFSLNESYALIEDFFYITSHRNSGAAFGFLENQQWLFIIVTTVVICIILYYFWRLRDKPSLLALGFSFILGGSLGNLLDRITTGKVVDFLHFKFGMYSFPIFNVADISIVVGVAILLLLTFKEENFIINEK